MLPVIWNEEAETDLAEVTEYIAPRNPDAAQRLKNAMEHSAERLGVHPYLHRTGRVPGTRECVVHPNYILIYRVDADAVRILSVLHTSQQYP